ncbi:transcription initiation factor IIA subunit 1-like [Xenia sp. Carnegie-2017]|uniref:transcription initiation factor IIA subunit 1-like n=1 Tax=Xenia sp. Carnegie-2017 TaxID=2897299 RepID=UPI001F04B069|nr:transcription initiation factor IIA subunit 1-like [Xenia sp. Carnegie-2017]
MNSQINASKVYKGVIDEVIKNVREAFLNDGVDEQVLQELKQIWESKVTQSEALSAPPQSKPSTPVILSNQTAVVHSTSQQQMNIRRQIPTKAMNISQSIASSGSMTVKTQQREHFMTPQQQYISHQPHAQFTQILVPGNGVPTIQQQMHMPPHLRPAYHGLSAIQTKGEPSRQVVHVTNQTIQNNHPTIQKIQSQTTKQQQQTARPSVIIQVDGPNDSDSEEDDDDEDDDDENNTSSHNEDEEDKPTEDSEPLNSDDDLPDSDSSDLFDTDNVVVCQFDRITRSKNKWKFHLKDGIMNLNTKDFIFNKANGEAEW